MIKEHSDKTEVAAACAKHGRERDDAFDLIKNRGNYVHNIKVIRGEKEGCIIVCRQGSKQGQIPAIADFLPCTNCFGFYRNHELWRHRKSFCQHRKGDVMGGPRSHGLQAEARLFLESCTIPENIINGVKVDKQFKNDVLQKMNQDNVYKAAVQDPLILAFGQILYTKLGKRRANNISQRMRQLGRIKMELDRSDSNRHHMKHYISGRGFDLVIDAVYAVAELVSNEQDDKIFRKPSLALRLGHDIIKMAELKRGKSIREEDDVGEKEADRFIKLKKAEWADRVSTIAVTTLSTNKFNKPSFLPLTKDLVTLRQYLDNKAKKYCEELERRANYNNWRNLADILLCLLTVFNKRRGGEVEELRLSTYMEKKDWTKTANAEVIELLEPLEKELFEW